MQVRQRVLQQLRERRPVQEDCSYSDSEKKCGFRQVLYTLDEAIEINRRMLEAEGRQAWNQREYNVLQLIKEHLNQAR